MSEIKLEPKPCEHKRIRYEITDISLEMGTVRGPTAIIRIEAKKVCRDCLMTIGFETFYKPVVVP